MQNNAHKTATFNLYEATISELLAAYQSQTLSPVAVVARFLERISAYDMGGSALNSIIVLNPHVLEEAAAAAARWRNGTARALEGVPFTVKDSYMVAGMTVASGSPAFAGLIAQWDAFTVQQLKEAGAILIGKTNMPPMADGGMQRGVYGRAENPYNGDYLAAAYASGSSNGSGVATAANFAVFGMGEETVSSGRSPASNNGLCAYTPSWGVLSIRGNWPLFPARDVVVPHTRTIADMLQLLNTLVSDDPETRGDFWRHQQVVKLPQASAIRPQDYRSLADSAQLAGKVFAVPRMYLGKDPNFPMPLRESVLEKWAETVARLEKLGAKIVESDFPLIEKYEADKPAGENIDRLGVLPDEWMTTEFNHFLAFGWDDFLRANGDPNIPNLACVDPDTIFPLAAGTLPDRYEEVPDYENRYRAVVAYAKQGITDPRDREDFAAGIKALITLREQLFESWLAENGYDAVIFPANADVGHESSERDLAENDHTWQNGVLFSNGNYALRHLGLPSVTVSMGALSDIQVPIGVTFVGSAYSDNELLGYAALLDADGFCRPVPQAAPENTADTLALTPDALNKACNISFTQCAAEETANGIALSVRGVLSNAEQPVDLRLTAAGVVATAQLNGTEFSAEFVVPAPQYGLNPDPRKVLLVATAHTATGAITAAMQQISY